MDETLFQKLGSFLDSPETPPAVVKVSSNSQVIRHCHRFLVENIGTPRHDLNISKLTPKSAYLRGIPHENVINGQSLDTPSVDARFESGMGSIAPGGLSGRHEVVA